MFRCIEFSTRMILAGLAVVNRKRGAVQITFELEAGLAREVFVFGFAILRDLLAEVGKQANRLEVHIEDGISIRQQADRIGCGALAQQEGAATLAPMTRMTARGDPEFTPAIPHG